MDTLKHILEFGSSPAGILIMLLSTGLVLLPVRRCRSLGCRLLVLGASLFVVLTLTPAAEIGVTLLERPYRPIDGAADLAGVDRIVVLSEFGRERPGIPITSSLSDECLCRLVEGVRLYRLRPGSKIVVSGGVLSEGQRPVAEMMAQVLTLLGVLEADILIEGRSTTTYENLVHVQTIVGRSEFALVASARDLPRAMGVARRLGMQPVPAPACIRTLHSYPAGMTAGEWFWTVLDSFRYPSLQRLRDLQAAHHEYLGYLWYRFRGWI